MCFGERRDLASSQRDRLVENMGRDVKSLSAQGVVEKTHEGYSDQTSVPCTALCPRQAEESFSWDQLSVLMPQFHRCFLPC